MKVNSNLMVWCKRWNLEGHKTLIRKINKKLPINFCEVLGVVMGAAFWFQLVVFILSFSAIGVAAQLLILSGHMDGGLITESSSWDLSVAVMFFSICIAIVFEAIGFIIGLIIVISWLFDQFREGGLFYRNKPTKLPTLKKSESFIYLWWKHIKTETCFYVEFED